jgi:Na+/H+ antiporter NhaD/arsenite permease-like protein
VVQTLMRQAGLGGHDWGVWSANFVAHGLAATLAYVLFGGLRLARAGRVAPPEDHTALTGHHWFTLAVLAAWVTGVVAFNLNPGLSAAAAAALIILAGAGDDAAMLKAVPWGVVVMVTGVSVLVGVLEKTGGMDLFTTMLARISRPDTVNGTIAFVTGTLSTYSSTSGVVYPAFLPAVPGIVEKLGGGNPLEVAMSINVGAALVDVSPLSTIGALCLAAIPSREDPRALFRKLLAWGFAMTIVGALFAQLAIRWFAG